MTPQMILDRMAQMIRVGFVNARQPEKMRVKVTVRDTTGAQLVTDWLPVLCPRASGDMQYDLPDVGDQVLCLFLPYGLEQGFVVGAMYGKQTPPVQSGDKWHRTFADGTTLEYDRAAHKLSANVQGDFQLEATGKIEMKAGASMTLEAPIIYERGTLVNTAKDGSPGNAVISGGIEVSNGGIKVTGGDVVAAGVSLVSHTTESVQPGSGTSGTPTGGSVASPGTASKPLPAPGTPAYDAAIEDGLERAAQKVDALPDSKFKKICELILCLPTITAAEAEDEDNKVDKKGWIYLHDMFQRWISGIARPDALSNPDIFWIPLSWVLSYNRAAEQYALIKDSAYLFSKNAKQLLAERLQRDGKLTGAFETFDYINTPESQWFSNYFQSLYVRDQNTLPVDGLQAAMAGFRFRALAKGYVKPTDCGHEITIEEIAIVATDSFNFAGEQSYKFWRCKPPARNYLEFIGSTELLNEDFRNFRDKLGFGDDFMVLTKPKLIELDEEVSYDTSL